MDKLFEMGIDRVTRGNIDDIINILSIRMDDGQSARQAVNAMTSIEVRNIFEDFPEVLSQPDDSIISYFYQLLEFEIPRMREWLVGIAEDEIEASKNFIDDTY